MHIWDNFGTERLLPIIRDLYYKDAHAAMFVYAVDDERSLYEIEYSVKYLDSESHK